MCTLRRVRRHAFFALILAGAFIGMLFSFSPGPLRAADDETGPAPTYVGSKACLVCHAQTVPGWAASGHGKSLGAAELPEDERDCEACHGPGSGHVGSAGKKPIPLTMQDPAQVETACARCHLRDQGSKLSATWPNLNAGYWSRTDHARQGTSCGGCHQIHGGSGKDLRQPAEALCRSCHKEVVNTEAGGYTHDPVAKGQCLLCHTPHGGAARHNLLDNPSAACLQCHPAGEALQKPHGQYAVAQSDCLSCHNPHSFDRAQHLIRKNRHVPFAAGKCETCHLPSEGEAKPALSKPQKQLCLTCHPADKIMPTQTADGKALVQHPPVQQGLCTTCHNPHASDQDHLVKDRLNNVCFACHSKIEAATLLPVSHRPVAGGNCLLCHQPHVSPTPQLLNKPAVDECRPCHATQMKFSHPVGMREGKPVIDPTNGKMLVCARCHAVHGSKLENLMPVEVNDLCVGCHKQ